MMWDVRIAQGQQVVHHQRIIFSARARSKGDLNRRKKLARDYLTKEAPQFRHGFCDASRGAARVEMSAQEVQVAKNSLADLPGVACAIRFRSYRGRLQQVRPGPALP